MLAAASFSVMAVCIKALSNATLWGDFHLPPSEVIFLRSLMPTLMLLPTALRHRPSTPMTGRLWSHLGCRGVLGAAAMASYFLAVYLAPLSVAVVTSNTSPLWTALLSALILKETFPRALWWALPLSFLGCYWATAASTVVSPGLVPGAILGLLSALFSGMAYTYVRQLRILPPSWVALSLTSVASVVVLPWSPSWIWPTPMAWIWVVAMGLSAAFAQLWMTIGFHHNGAARANALGLAGVPFSALLGVLVFQDSLSLLQLLGIALVLTGVLAVLREPEGNSP